MVLTWLFNLMVRLMPVTTVEFFPATIPLVVNVTATSMRMTTGTLNILMVTTVKNATMKSISFVSITKSLYIEKIPPCAIVWIAKGIVILYVDDTVYSAYDDQWISPDDLDDYFQSDWDGEWYPNDQMCVTVDDHVVSRDELDNHEGIWEKDNQDKWRQVQKEMDV